MRNSSLACLLVLISCGVTRAQDKLSYNRDIRPILFENCFRCHGPDSASRKADLRLDQRQAAIDAGAFVPGDADSELVEHIFSTDPEKIMPPPASHKVLTAEQKEILKRWVAEGAEYEPHWSFIAPTRPVVPAEPEALAPGATWVRNPIDAFIANHLKSLDLTPNPEADKRTLARRVALDLTGLPPQPELLEKFVADASPDAYERLVDELLKSPRWGEHRGRHWLDYARYADTHGIHFDNYREIWAYRDWVIGAFNRNLPFDQFTIEQLAGDLLPERSMEQWIASGFNRCNITTNEGGIIDEEYLVLYARDRTETFSQVWLGLTTGCATCHDHKFDPISTKDFYSLAAFFNNSAVGARDGNIKDPAPNITVPLESDRARWEVLEKDVPAAKQKVEDRRAAARPDFDTWLSSATVDSLGITDPLEGLYLKAAFAEGQGTEAAFEIDQKPTPIKLNESAKWIDGTGGAKALELQGGACEIADAGDFEKDQGFSYSAWIKLQGNDGHGAICSRMNNEDNYRGWDFWVQRRQVGTHIVSQWAGDALKVVASKQVPANEWTHVCVTYDGSGKAAGVAIYYNGEAQAVSVEADKLTGSIKTTVPFKVGQRSQSDPLHGAGLQDLRIYKRTLTAAEAAAMAKASRYSATLTKAAEQRTDVEKNELYAYWLESLDAGFKDLKAQAATLEQEQAAVKGRGTIAHVMVEKNEAAMAYILLRGEYDKRSDQVSAETPGALPAFMEGAPRNRLGLANWALRPENPLTTRVTVNRFWQEVFGTGLVRSAGDFGIAGEQPSHPELLDWLAVEFRESGWDIKKFFKLIVMSATYRQSAQVTQAKLDKDPHNRFLSRGPRFRMDAEMVRDYALDVSGLLSSKIGGPSVKPYMPDGVWEAVAMIGSNTRDYKRDTGESLYRRSMYTFWKRSAPPAQMDIFNAPPRETCTIRRERTNTPLQALTTLNDEQFVEAARNLAQLTLKSPATTDDERLQHLTTRLLCRPLTAEELVVVRSSLRELSTYYAAHPEEAGKLLTYGESKADASLPPADLAAWTMLANELLNLDEVLVK